MPGVAPKMRREIPGLSLCSAGIVLGKNAARIDLVGRSRLLGSDAIQFRAAFVAKVYIVAARTANAICARSYRDTPKTARQNVKYRRVTQRSPYMLSPDSQGPAGAYTYHRVSRRSVPVDFRQINQHSRTKEPKSMYIYIHIYFLCVRVFRFISVASI